DLPHAAISHLPVPRGARCRVDRRRGRARGAGLDPLPVSGDELSAVGRAHHARRCRHRGGERCARRRRLSSPCPDPGLHVLRFRAGAFLVVVTPGADTALVTRNALLYGRAAAVATAVGVNVGIAFWTVAASIGLAAVVAASAEAFTAIKLAGAV